MASEPLDLVPGGAGPRLDGDQAIPLVATTVVAFIGRTERGPLNEPVAVKSFDEYRRVFGGHCSFSFVSLAVQHFFIHGGEAAIVVRVANRASRALIELPAGPEVLRLQARQPGSREFLRASVDYDRVEQTSSRFNLVVQRLSRQGSQLVDDQELFEALSMDSGDDRFVVDALQDSELIRLTGPLPLLRPDATRATHPGEPIPYIEASVPGTDGEELTDYDIIGSNTDGTGLFALEQCENVDLVCIPSPPGHDLGSTSFVAATRYCERRGALLIWDPPWSWYSADSAVLSVRSSGQVSQSAVTYFPRVRPRGDLGRYPNGMPASGVVAGILARCDRAGVWHRLPPADAALKGNLTPLADIDDRQARVLNRIGVNVFRRSPPGVTALQGNVTFAGPSAVASLSQSLGMSRLVSFVLRSIERHTRWVFAAPRALDVSAILERQVWIFLSRLQQHGALAGKNAEQAFFVRAKTTRTAADATGDRDVAVTLRVAFAPQTPNELLVYDVRYHERRMTAEIVPVLDAERHLGP